MQSFKHYFHAFYSLLRKKLWLLIGVLLSLIGVWLGFNSHMFGVWKYYSGGISRYEPDADAIVSFVLSLSMIMWLLYLYEHNKVLGKRALFLTLLVVLLPFTDAFGTLRQDGAFFWFLWIFVGAGCLLWSIVDDYRK